MESEVKFDAQVQTFDVGVASIQCLAFRHVQTNYGTPIHCGHGHQKFSDYINFERHFAQIADNHVKIWRLHMKVAPPPDHSSMTWQKMQHKTLINVDGMFGKFSVIRVNAVSHLACQIFTLIRF